MESIIYEKGQRRAIVRGATTSNAFVVEFWINAGGWFQDLDLRGTDGLGQKTYDTMEKAIRAAKRYINKE